MRYISSVVTRIQMSRAYAVLIIGLALLSISLLGYEMLYQLDHESLFMIRSVDMVVAFIFLGDFVLGLLFNNLYPSKILYFKHNWLNLLSAIPVSIEFAQLLRFLRILSAFRTIRAGLSVRKINKNFKKKQ